MGNPMQSIRHAPRDHVVSNFIEPAFRVEDYRSENNAAGRVAAPSATGS
jgi:hypothetical protein